jgi:hypothetical protein
MLTKCDHRLISVRIGSQAVTSQPSDYVKDGVSRDLFPLEMPYLASGEVASLATVSRVVEQAR